MNPLLLKVPERIVARRVILRVLRPDDAPAVNRAIVESARELKLWMPWVRGQPPTLEQTAQYCREAAIDFESRREFRMALFHRGDQRLLGGAGLVRGDWLVPKFEVGYWIRTSETGRGYVTEAVKALTQFARRFLRVRRLEIRTDARNRRSMAVAKRAGFQLEGRLRQDSRDSRNRLRDTMVFARIF